ncbi:MAG: hypothetical protein RIC18_04220 [Hoeflea sp.]
MPNDTTVPTYNEVQAINAGGELANAAMTRLGGEGGGAGGGGGGSH